MNNRKEKTIARTALLSILIFLAVHGCFLRFAVEVGNAQGVPNSLKPSEGGGSAELDEARSKSEPLNEWANHGSSLGMSLSGTEPGGFRVTNVRANLAADLAGTQ
jgi:hypothetical protein